MAEPEEISLYARVSTVDKDQDPENQLVPEREFAAAKYPNFKQVEYVDFESGKDIEVTKRKEFLTMFKALESGKSAGIVVKRPDRFSRSVRDGANYVYTLIRLEKFMDVIDRGLHIDKNTPKTTLTLFALEQAANQLESALIADRVKDAIDRRRKAAEQAGVPFQWGKKKTKYKGIELTPMDKEKVVSMRKLGLSVRVIARELKIGRGRVWEVVKELEKNSSIP